MMPRRLPCLALLISTALALAAGCGGNEGPGSVVVPYRLGATDQSCAAAGVQRIRITLGDGDHQALTACSDDKLARVDLVRAGRYEMRVEALDGGNYTILDNGGAPADQRRVNVPADAEVTTPEVTLSATPMTVMMRWNFGFSSCANAMVDNFQVLVLEDGGLNQLGVATIPCSADPEDADGFRVIPDPDRTFRGTRADTIVVRPRTKSGATVGNQLDFDLESPPGNGRIVKLTLDCEAQGCTSGTFTVE